MKTLAYIPARLKSTRFENKILKHFLGKPLLQWAYENAKKSDLFDAVIILADDPVTVDLAKSFNAPVYLTSKNPQNGTERIIEALENGAPTADKIVNVQADEPLLNKTVFQTLLKGEGDAGCRIWTLKRKIETQEELHAPQIVKVVTNWRGEALYFSRSVIPFDRDNTGKGAYYRHVGLYAYTPEALKKISTLPRSSLESTESLEQLTPLYHGIPIEVFETSEVIHGVDVPEDLVKLERMACQISI